MIYMGKLLFLNFYWNRGTPIHFHIIYFMANVIGLLREITAFVKGIRVLFFAFS